MADDTNRSRNETPGGVLPGTGGVPAFSHTVVEQATLPVLLAVPHAGRDYPPDLLAAMRQPDQACLRLEDRLADAVARAVAERTGAALLVAHAPRALVDLNRAPDDMDWDMVEGGAPRGAARLAAGRRARSGLGLVPRRLAGLGELWQRRMTRDDLDARIALVHRPYHTALARSLEALRDRWGGAVLVDLHSMPPLGPKSGPQAAADFVIGDRFGAACAQRISSGAIHVLERAGRRVAHNRPYAGGYVLDSHAAPQRGLHAIQVEMCRAAYLDAQLREPGEGMAGVVDCIAALVCHVATLVDEGWSRLPQAAE